MKIESNFETPLCMFITLNLSLLGHWWNSETCSTAEVIKYLNIPTQSSVDVGGPFSINVTINSSSLDEPANTSLPEALIQLKNVTTPVEEFWE